MDRLEDYLRTLEACRKALPPETDHIHYERLRKIERFVRRALAYPNQRRGVEAKIFDLYFENDAWGG